MTKGIDVSTWQGKIDRKQVKGAGIHYAILRSSFGSPDPSQVDNQFENNYKGAKAAGIPEALTTTAMRFPRLRPARRPGFSWTPSRASNSNIPSITT